MTKAEIREWIVGRIASLTGLTRQEIDPSESFADFGIGSKDAVMLMRDLEVVLGRSIPPTLPWDCPNIESACEYLAGDVEPSVQLENGLAVRGDGL
jgi:acyl carrier protein